MNFLSSIICLVGSVVFICGDELKLSPIERVIVKTVIWEGKPRFATLETIRANISEYFALLNEEEIRNEIELIDEQKKEIEDLLQFMHRESQKNLAKWNGKPPTHDQIVELEKLQVRCRESVKNILLPIQLERLEQIRNRISIRYDGIGKFLDSSLCQFKKDLSVGEKQDIKKGTESIRQLIQQEYGAMVKESLQKILSSLTSEQRLDVDEYLKVNDLLVDNFDIFLAQMQYALAHTTEIGVDDSEKFKNMMEWAPFFRLTFDGRFEAHKSGYGMFDLASFVHQDANPDANQLKLTDDQKQELIAAFNKYWAGIKEHHRIQSEELRVEGEIRTSTGEDYNHFVESESVKLNETCDKLLLPAQRSATRMLFAKKLLRQYGLIADLLNGDLGRNINLSPDQRRKIRDICKKEIQRYEGKLLKWDEKIIKAVKAGMTDENAKEFDSAIGDELTYVVPTLEMLLAKND